MTSLSYQADFNMAVSVKSDDDFYSFKNYWGVEDFSQKNIRSG